MTFTFKPAKRQGVHLLIGLMGGTGSGKTYSALSLAKGLSNGKPFAFIDTEAGRALHYADRFDFHHGDMAAPFRPSRYLEAIEAADKAGYPVVVVDSFSHEHAGEGGLLDMHEDQLDKMVQRALKKQGQGASEWQLRDSFNMTAWIEPKTEHKSMVQRLLQLRAHLILCFRAEPKVKIERNPKTGKTEIIDAGWKPVAAKGIEFELTCSFLLSHEAPGKPVNPLKLPEQLKRFFPPDQCIGERAGREIAAWSAGDDVEAIVRGMAQAKTLDELKAAAESAKGLAGQQREDAMAVWRSKHEELAAKQPSLINEQEPPKPAPGIA